MLKLTSDEPTEILVVCCDEPARAMPGDIDAVQ